MTNNSYLFTSESLFLKDILIKFVTEYQIWLSTHIYQRDPFSRVACETLTTTNKVVLAGEIRGPKIDKEEIIQKVRNCIKDIGYDQTGFSWKTANSRNFFT